MNKSYRVTKRFVFAVGFTIISATQALAQQAWFIYIQSESKQPFYARIEDKIYSSSGIGYLTIANLKDSTYNIVVGFPKNQFPEQTFSIALNKKDHGYQLRKATAAGWVLYNWQNSNTIRSLQSAPGNSLLYGERKKDDAFAALMGAVVNDSAVLYTSVVKKAPVIEGSIAVAKADTLSPVNGETVMIDTIKQTGITMADTVSVKKQAKTETVKTMVSVPDTLAEAAATPPVLDTAKKSDLVIKPAEEIKEPVKKEEEKKPLIIKVREQNRNNEKRLVFVDGSISGKTDTITMIIPVEKPPVPKKEIVTAAKTDSINSKGEAGLNKAKAVMNAPIVEKDTIAIVTADKPEEKADTNTAVTKQEVKPPVSLINSDCLNFATDNEVDKLRVKMLAAKDDNNRVFTAYKVFKTKCFSTRQIRGLSELFSTDEYRYKFFEAAYPFVSDSTRFKQLVELINDEFFKTRFKTLVRL